MGHHRCVFQQWEEKGWWFVHLGFSCSQVSICFFYTFDGKIRSQVRSAQFSHSVMSNSFWPHGLQHIRFPCLITNSWSLLKLLSIKLVIQPSHLCRPLLLPPSVFPSIRVFSTESALCIRWPKYWSSSISPSNEYLGLISFRMDWFDLLAVQGTLKSLLQHHNSNISLLWRSVFFMVQLSHPYMTTGKTIALTIWTFIPCWGLS